jgi:hypothetical protein
MMLGPKAFGFPVGRRLKSKAGCTQIVTHAEETAYWFNFTLPAPESMIAEHVSTTSCLIMFLLFLIAPQLKRIPAFNLGGKGWKMKRIRRAGTGKKQCRDDGVRYPQGVLKKSIRRGGTGKKQCRGHGVRNPQGVLKVGFTSAGNDRQVLVSITATDVKTQNQLRLKLVKREGIQQYAAIPTSQGERKRIKKAERRNKETAIVDA